MLVLAGRERGVVFLPSLLCSSATTLDHVFVPTLVFLCLIFLELSCRNGIELILYLYLPYAVLIYVRNFVA